MEKRNRNYVRRMRAKHIARKKNIVKNIYIVGVIITLTMDNIRKIKFIVVVLCALKKQMIQEVIMFGVARKKVKRIGNILII